MHHNLTLRRCAALYLIDCSEGHDEQSDEEVSHGQAEDQVVGHRLEVPVQQDSRNHKHVPCTV